MDQDPLFLVFLELCKAYNTVDSGRLLTTMESYDAGPCMFRLLEVFWDQKEVITRQNGYHGPHFKATQENTQGRIISPTLFNLIFDNVVRN